jgi:putative transposase
MCRVLDVRRSRYYAWRTGRPSPRRVENAVLQARIRAVYTDSDQTYGSPRVHHELRAQGIAVGRHRIARLMRAAGLWAVSRRRRRTTTRRDPRQSPAPDRLQRAFSVQAPDQVWATDLTYVETGGGWLYLAVVLDVGTRRVIGWAVARHLRDTLALEALAMALGRRRVRPGLLHHSDQGRQYTSRRYQAVLQQHGILPSMSRVGECWDNAVAESFFATLKCERLHRREYRTPEEAQHDIARYIEGWYNPRRRHSALGYLSPREYEEQFAA